MNRSDFKELARLRSEEATVLLSGGKFSGAYYLCGYVVECAMKACVAKQTRRYDYPDKKRTDASYTHDLEKLVIVADLKPLLDAELRANRVFDSNWATVKDWSEQSRYRKYTRLQAQRLFDAVHDPTNGALAWVQQRW